MTGTRVLPVEEKPEPKLLKNLIKRIAALPRGQAYAITLWVLEDENSEPMYTVKDLGKIENQR